MTKDEALHYAAAVFKSYALHHDNKGDHEKAARNDAHAQMMRDALAEPTIRENLTVDPTVSNSLKVQTQDALRLAQEAITDELEAVTDEEFEAAGEKMCDALEAIRKALVESVDMTEQCVDETPECGHEPVAWRNKETGTYSTGGFLVADEWEPLYTAPQPRQDVEPVKRPPNCGTGYCSCIECPFGELVEPVAWMHRIDFDQDERRYFEVRYEKTPGYCIPLYTAPQPRHDVDLTDDEIAVAVGSPLDEIYLADFRAVIAAYKGKNK